MWCLTLRDRTEWMEIVAVGWNMLVDFDSGVVERALAVTLFWSCLFLYGDGHAVERVVAALDDHFCA